ncbi:hypothetical protein B4135_2455 [Caldibacillus debilis]|uniref:Uncharacterized protein n=1 Tax=Caldibacillus debilis TaxID=301148 RepID=A0A150LZ00_9BACI|nr:hypothetical protein B4135_2455 [Caldibacillus debilis]
MGQHFLSGLGGLKRPIFSVCNPFSNLTRLTSQFAQDILPRSLKKFFFLNGIP